MTTPRPGVWGTGGRVVVTAAVTTAAAWCTAAAWSPVAFGQARVAAAGDLTLPLVVACALASGVTVGAAGLAALAPLALLALPLAAPALASAWVFAGPASVAVWAVTVSDAVWRWSGTRQAPASRTLAGTAWAPLLAAAVVLGTGAATLAPVAMVGDAPHYLTATQSLLHDGDLDLRNDYDQRTHRAFYGGSLEPRHTNPSPWGEQYPFHGLGVSVLVAPAYAAAGAGGATATLVAVMSVGAWLVWVSVRRATGNLHAAWFAWGALVAPAPYALHAAAIYPDGPAAVALAGALWLLVRLDDETPVALGTLALTGAGLAALPWLHVRLAVPAGVFGAAVIFVIARRQPDAWTRASWFLMVPIIGLAAWVASAYVMFGTWNPAAATLQRTAPNAWSAAPGGLLGLLADQEFGLVAVAPVFLALPWAFCAAWRRTRVLAIASGLCLASVMVMSSLWVWWGGDSAPARFLTVMTPAMALWLGLGWAEAGSGTRRALVAALALTGSLTWMLVTVDGGQHAYNFPDGRSSIFETAAGAVDLAAAVPSMFRPGATAGSEAPVAVAWALALVGAGVAMARWPRTPRTAPIGAAAALVTLAAGASAGWWLRDASPWTTARAQLAVFSELADVDAALTGPRPRLVAADDLARRLVLRTPETLASPTWQLYVPNLPAGRYAVRATRGSGGTTPLAVELGRDAWPYFTWSPGQDGPELALVTSLHSVRVPAPPQPTADVWLEPQGAPHRTAWPAARRVTRIGDLDVYGLDDSSYPEPTGVWLGGNRPSGLVIAARASVALTATFGAGPAAVSIDVVHGEERTTIDLAAQATKTIALGHVAADTPLGVTMTTRGGFPASLLHPGDSRTLAAWVTFGAVPTMLSPATNGR